MNACKNALRFVAVWAHDLVGVLAWCMVAMPYSQNLHSAPPRCILFSSFCLEISTVWLAVGVFWWYTFLPRFNRTRTTLLPRCIHA
jgi:hypothetical protein